jgi:hypothetical protein
MSDRLNAKPRDLLRFRQGALRLFRRWSRDRDGCQRGTADDPPEEAPAGTLAAIVIRHKKSAETLKYTVGDSWLPKLTEWNRTLDPRGRYEAV